MFHSLFRATVVATLFTFCCSNATLRSDIIVAADIGAISSSTVGSGNGTLDLRMFTFSGGEVNNTAGSFNGDNGNNTLPQGGGADIASFIESYVTTAGELQNFYILNFPDGFGGSTVTQLAIFLDLNETGAAAQATNMLGLLDVVINPTTINGNPNPAGDVTSATQAAINQIYTGGTIDAFLAQSFNLPVLSQGAGFADYVIFTGINPFSLNASDVVLINISMSSLNNGSEDIFLSGEFAAQDVAVPEPSATAALALFAWLGTNRRRRSK